MKPKFEIGNKVIFNDISAQQFNIPKGQVFTVKAITYQTGNTQHMITLVERPTAQFFESRLEHAYKYNHKLMPKLNLKTELQQLVKSHEIKSGLIDALAQEAFDEVAKSCRIAAERGKRSVTGVPVRYQGCKGGYEEHSTEVIGKLNILLQNEDLSFSIHSPTTSTGIRNINVSW